MIGGDYDSVPEGGPALKLTEQFMRGKSGISTTYDNRILCGIITEKQKESGMPFIFRGDFFVQKMEIWGFDVI